MQNDIRLKMIASIKRHEGLSKKPYKDSKGNLTIGYGRNLTDGEISEQEAEILLNNDIEKATNDLFHYLPGSKDLNDLRQAVLIEMTFNMGIERLLGFHKMINFIFIEHDFLSAAKEMLDSEWRKEVGNRANDLAYSMEMGIL